MRQEPRIESDVTAGVVSGVCAGPLAKDPTPAWPRRTKDGERRPRAHAEGLPQGELGVVDDGMLDVVPAHRLGDAGIAALVGKLGRVHAHDHEAVRHRVGLLEPFEVRQNVLASAAAGDAQHSARPALGGSTARGLGLNQGRSRPVGAPASPGERTRQLAQQ